MESESRIYRTYKDHLGKFGEFSDNKPRLAYVDDIPYAVKSHSINLCIKGYKTTGFSVSAGWAGATQQEIDELASKISLNCDVAIVDLDINGVDTYELMEKLKDKGRTVVIFSGAAPRLNDFNELKGLADLYLTKPMDEDKIIDEIEKLFHSKK